VVVVLVAAAAEVVVLVVVAAAVEVEGIFHMGKIQEEDHPWVAVVVVVVEVDIAVGTEIAAAAAVVVGILDIDLALVGVPFPLVEDLEIHVDKQGLFLDSVECILDIHHNFEEDNPFLVVVAVDYKAT